MFANPSSEHNHPGLLSVNAHIVQSPDIRYDVDVELYLSLVCLEIHHIA
jgi:hypothetical protein